MNVNKWNNFRTDNGHVVKKTVCCIQCKILFSENKQDDKGH